jgi:hypothetical protein
VIALSSTAHAAAMMMTDNKTDLPLPPPLGPSAGPSGRASFGAHAWGFVAGCVSGLAFVQIFGGGWFGLLLAYISLFPLYMAGLGGGRTPAITAALFGTLAVYLQTPAAGPYASLLYMVLFAMPAMVVARVMLLPIKGKLVDSGTILFVMLALGSILLLAMASLFTVSDESILALLQGMMESYKNAALEMNPDLDPAQVSQGVAMMTTMVLGLVAISWLCIHILNITIAQWLLTQAGTAKRAAPSLLDLDLPFYLLPLFVAAIITAYVLPETNIGLTAYALALLLGFGYMLVGLAIQHAAIVFFARRQGWSSILTTGALVFFYIVVTIVQIPLLLGVVLAVLDPWLAFRRRFLSTPHLKL